MKGFAFGCYNEVSGPIEIIINNNPGTGDFEFTVTSTLSTASLVLNKHLEAQYSETFFPVTIEKLMKKAGHDKRIYYRTENKDDPDKIILTLFKQGKEKKKNTIFCDRNTFPSDTVTIMCQALLLKGIKKDFLFDIISLEDALKARMEMSYYFTPNPCSLSRDFNFPEGIHNAIHPDEEYHIFKMKIHGLISLFLRSTWYFVYKARYPYDFVAYWGGDGIVAETFYFTEHEIIIDNK